MVKKNFLTFLIPAALLLFINSCTLNNANSVSNLQQGNFLFAQTSPDAPALSFLTNYTRFDTGLQYSTYSPYIKANSGAYSFSLLNDSSMNPVPFDTATVNIAAKQSYSYFIIDSFNKIKSAFVNDVFHAPGGDTTFIRFFNFCPNAPQPINLVDSSSNNAILSAGRTFNDEVLNPQYVAFTPYVLGDSTIVSLKFVSGTSLKTQVLKLQKGRVYTLIAKGFYGITDPAKALSIGVLENYPQKSIAFTF